MSAFTFARDRGYCVGNPAEKSAKAKVVEGTVGILTVEQTATLLAQAADELVPYIAIGAFAGLRRAELERLDWREVDLAAGLIEVTASKAKSARRRFVRIKPSLKQWLAPYAQPRGNVTPSDYRELFDKARESAGIETWPSNALRHGFASFHLAHFKDATALALEMGHTNSNLIFQHYRQLVKPKQAARYWKIAPALARDSKKVLKFATAVCKVLLLANRSFTTANLATRRPSYFEASWVPWLTFANGRTRDLILVSLKWPLGWVAIKAL